jgi:hypothetical protein
MLISCSSEHHSRPMSTDVVHVQYLRFGHGNLPKHFEDLGKLWSIRIRGNWKSIYVCRRTVETLPTYGVSERAIACTRS